MNFRGRLWSLGRQRNRRPPASLGSLRLMALRKVSLILDW